MDSNQANNCTLALKFNNELKLENPEDFKLTAAQTKFLELQLALLVEEAKTEVRLLVIKND